MFVQTIREEDATGRVAEIYRAQKQQIGFVMTTAQCLTARPDLLPIYTDFVEKIRGSFSLGPAAWRLITLIAAKHVPSTYCSYVYGQQLIADLGSKAKVMEVQRDFRSAGLPARDVAMLSYAEKVVTDASRIIQNDIDALRQAGFSDREICDIALCAAFRCFCSRMFEALGAGPEPVFIDSDPDFRAAMTVGRAA